MAVASAGLYASLHLAPDRQPHQHPTTLMFFTGRMPFMPPNQQCQITAYNCLNKCNFSFMCIKIPQCSLVIKYLWWGSFCPLTCCDRGHLPSPSPPIYAIVCTADSMLPAVSSERQCMLIKQIFLNENKTTISPLQCILSGHAETKLCCTDDSPCYAVACTVQTSKRTLPCKQTMPFKHTHNQTSSNISQIYSQAQVRK